MTDNYLVTDSGGVPDYVVDLEQITDLGQKLAFDLAANADDRGKLEDIATDLMRRIGPKMFGMVAANAVIVLAYDILEPTLAVAASYGADLRPGLRKLAREQHRDTGGSE